MGTPLHMEFNRAELQKLGEDNIMAIYEMRKPSQLPSSHRRRALPRVCLDLKEKQYEFQFEVMHKVTHKYILRVEAIIEQDKVVEGQNALAAFVEPHSGPLIAFLKKFLFERDTNAVPSQTLREFIRQIVVAVEMLRKNGFYHGDLSLNNIYYSMENDVVTIKLTNFRRKDEGISLEVAQLGDWISLGHVLAYISNGAKALNAKAVCFVIDHLASKLQALTEITSLPDLMSNTLSDPLFWDTRKKTNFFINDIPRALKDPIFLTRVNRYRGWHLPWKNSPHNGLIAAMDNYRKTVLNKAHYDGSDPVENLKCMSGAYTHQDDLEGKVWHLRRRMSVDDAVQTNQPDLTLTVYMLMTGEIAAEEAVAAGAAEAAAAAGAPQ